MLYAGQPDTSNEVFNNLQGNDFLENDLRPYIRKDSQENNKDVDNDLHNHKDISLQCLDSQKTSNALATLKSHVSQKGKEEIFRRLRETIAPNECLISDYSCVLLRDIYIHGRLFLSQSSLSFYANTLGWETKLNVEWKQIKAITKGKTAKIVPNAIHICTGHKTHYFSGFLNRDNAYTCLIRIWQNASLGHPQSSADLKTICNQKVPLMTHDTDEDKREERTSEVPKQRSRMRGLLQNVNKIKKSAVSEIQQFHSNKTVPLAHGFYSKSVDILSDRVNDIQQFHSSKTVPLAHGFYSKSVDLLTDGVNEIQQFHSSKTVPKAQEIYSKSVDLLSDRVSEIQQFHSSKTVPMAQEIYSKSIDLSDKVKNAVTSRNSNSNSPEGTENSPEIKENDPEIKDDNCDITENCLEEIEHSLETNSLSTPKDSTPKENVNSTTVNQDKTSNDVPTANRNIAEINTESDFHLCCPYNDEDTYVEYINEVFNFNVDVLYDYLFNENSFLMKKVYKHQRFENVRYSPLDEGMDGTRSRELCYSISLSLGICNTTTKHIIAEDNIKGSHYHVNTESVSSGVPYGDAFYVKSIYCISESDGTSARLRVKSTIEYTRRLFSFTKTIIEKTTYKGLEDFSNCLQNVLREVSDEIMVKQVVETQHEDDKGNEISNVVQRVKSSNAQSMELSSEEGNLVISQDKITLMGISISIRTFLVISIFCTFIAFLQVSC